MTHGNVYHKRHKKISCYYEVSGLQIFYFLL